MNVWVHFCYGPTAIRQVSQSPVVFLVLGQVKHTGSEEFIEITYVPVSILEVLTAFSLSTYVVLCHRTRLVPFVLSKFNDGEEQINPVPHLYCFEGTGVLPELDSGLRGFLVPHGTLFL